MLEEVKRSKPSIRLATLDDLQELIRNIRDADVNEIIAATNTPPTLVIIESFNMSEDVFCVHRDDEVIALLGVVRVDGVDAGVPWMMATDGLETIKKTFIKDSRIVLNFLLKKYHYLENHVWSKNTVHVRWLRWLGFTFEDAAPAGPRGELFHRFYMRSQDV